MTLIVFLHVKVGMMTFRAATVVVVVVVVVNSGEKSTHWSHLILFVSVFSDVIIDY